MLYRYGISDWAKRLGPSQMGGDVGLGPSPLRYGCTPQLNCTGVPFQLAL